MLARPTMLRAALAVSAVALCSCGAPDAATPTSTAAIEPALPPAVDVCVEQPDGSLVAGTAVPSRAGVYDPSMPIVPQHLNWTVSGQGCVEYPGDAARRATCGGAEAPVVGRRPCMR